MLNEDILDDEYLEIPDDGDTYYPGDFDKDISDSLVVLQESLKSMQEQLNQSSEISEKQFYIATLISLFGLIAAAIAAVAAVIPLLQG